MYVSNTYKKNYQSFISIAKTYANLTVLARRLFLRCAHQEKKCYFLGIFGWPA